MKQHSPDHQNDHSHVKLSYPAHRNATGIGGERRIHMDLGRNKLVGDSRMALATGLDQVGTVDRRSLIARRQDVVHSMATGTIRYHLRTEFGRQSMVAREVGGRTVPLETKLLR